MIASTRTDWRAIVHSSWMMQNVVLSWTGPLTGTHLGRWPPLDLSCLWSVAARPDWPLGPCISHYHNKCYYVLPQARDSNMLPGTRGWLAMQYIMDSVANHNIRGDSSPGKAGITSTHCWRILVASPSEILSTPVKSCSIIIHMGLSDHWAPKTDGLSSYRLRKTANLLVFPILKHTS